MLDVHASNLTAISMAKGIHDTRVCSKAHEERLAAACENTYIHCVCAITGLMIGIDLDSEITGLMIGTAT